MIIYTHTSAREVVHRTQTDWRGAGVGLQSSGSGTSVNQLAERKVLTGDCHKIMVAAIFLVAFLWLNLQQLAAVLNLSDVDAVGM